MSEYIFECMYTSAVLNVRCSTSVWMCLCQEAPLDAQVPFKCIVPHNLLLVVYRGSNCVAKQVSLRIPLDPGHYLIPRAMPGIRVLVMGTLDGIQSVIGY